MSRSTGAKVTVVPYDSTSTNQNWTLKTPSWITKLTSTSVSNQSRSTTPIGCLPQHNVPMQFPPSTSLISTSNATVPSKPTIHLLACTHRTQRRKCLLQDPIDPVSTDRALFCFMKQQLQRSRSRIRSLLSMRSVQGMFFVKVCVSSSGRVADQLIFKVSPADGQHSRGSRSRSMLYLDELKYVRVHTSSLKG